MLQRNKINDNSNNSSILTCGSGTDHAEISFEKVQKIFN